VPRGANRAILACAAFARPEPVTHETGRIRVGPHGVRALAGIPRRRREFGRAAFAADPPIAAPAWDRQPPAHASFTTDP
jgi:hypothetical protein